MTDPSPAPDPAPGPAGPADLRTTGGPLPPGNPHNPGQLTDRELEVMTMIGLGHSNAEIADELYLSVNTIKTHVRNAYRRVGLRRRVDAVVWTMAHLATPEAAPSEATPA